MKRFRKVTALLVILTLTITSITCTTWNATVYAASNMTIVNTDFESDVIGQEPTGFDVSAGINGSVTVTDKDAYSGSKSLSFLDGESSSVVKLTKSFDSATQVKVDFKLKSPNEWVDLYLKGEGSYGPRFYFKSDSTIYYYDGSFREVAKYVPNQWYHVSLDIDATANKYDIYLDGQLVKAQADFHGNKTSLDYFVMETGKSYKATGVYVDDLSVWRALTAPSLMADTTINRVGEKIELEFIDDAQWRGAITDVLVDGQSVDYSTSEGKIQIDGNVFLAAKADYEIVIQSQGYFNARVVQEILPGAPALIADTTNNVPNNAINIRFDDDDSWRNAITEIKVNDSVLIENTDHTIESGKIRIEGNAFPSEGIYNILVSATDYSDNTVSQAIYKVPPVLTADISDNTFGTSIDLTFHVSDSVWSSEITGVQINDQQVSKSKYSVNQGSISLDASLFAEVSTYTISVSATGYVDSFVKQKILPLGDTPLILEDFTNNTINNTIELTYFNNEQWENAITGIYIDGNIDAEYTISRHNDKESKIIIDGKYFKIAKNYTITIGAKGYLDVHVFQNIKSNLLEPPVLRADNVENIMNNEIDITFTDDEMWRNAITHITIDGQTIAESVYQITEGNINILPNVFNEGDIYDVVVFARGYKDVKVNQPIKSVQLKQVSGMMATAVSPNKVILLWDAVSDADYYKVYRGITSDFSPVDNNLVKKIATNKYHDFMLHSSTEYYYKIAAVNTSGVEGVVSDAVEVITLNDNSITHPSIFFYPDEVNEIKSRYTSGLWKEWYESQKEYADQYIDTPVSQVNVKTRGNVVNSLCTIYFVSGEDIYKNKIIEYMNDIPSCTLGAYDYSTLYVTYGNKAYGFAYDLLYNELSEADRIKYANDIKTHAMPVYDSIDSKTNNWIEVMAAGLAVAGGSIRGIIIEEEDWGQKFLDKASANMERALSDSIDGHVIGEGAYDEGECYVAYAFEYGIDGMIALRNLGHSDLINSKKYQDVLAYRIKNLLPMANYPLYEDAGLGYHKTDESLSWIASSMLDHNDPTIQKQLRWLYDKVRSIDGTPVDKRVWSAYYAHYSDINEPKAPEANSRIDTEAGIAYLRGGLDDEDLALTMSAKTYIANSSHDRPDEGSFEIYGYGSYLIHQPGYSKSGEYSSYWQGKKAHNVVIVDDSPRSVVGAEGFTTYSIGNGVEYVEADITSPYAGTGSLKRTAVFVRPTPTVAGYYILVDHVTTTNPEASLDWYLHGRSRDLTISGNNAVWKIDSWLPEGEDVYMHAHFAAPSVTLAKEKDNAPEYTWGTTSAGKQHTEFIRARAVESGSNEFLTVLYPRKASIAAPEFINYSQSNGVTINSNDVAFVQNTNSNKTVEGITSDALFAFARKNGNKLDFFFVKNGSNLNNNSNIAGFSSDKNVEIVFDRFTGSIKVLEANTNITLRSPEINTEYQVKVDDSLVASTASGGMICFTIEEIGSHTIELIPLQAPNLIAETVKNTVGNPVDIKFTDNYNWRKAITAIMVDGVALRQDAYTLTEGILNIERSVFPYVKNYKIVIEADGYRNTVVNQKMLAVGETPYLNVDTTNNIPGNNIEITFSTNAAWSNAVTSVTIDGQLLTEGIDYRLENDKIIIYESVLQAVRNYTIEIKAYGYTDVSISQEMIAIAPTPELIADTTENAVGQNIEITFEDNPQWQQAIKAIQVNNKSIEGVVIARGVITIPASAFTLGKTYEIVVKALGYIDAVVSQEMVAAAEAPSARNVAISGAAQSGQRLPGISGIVREGMQLTGTYSFRDANDDSESTSTFRWLISDSIEGEYVPISSATSSNYTVTADDLGKYIKFEVTPVSDIEPAVGTPVLTEMPVYVEETPYVPTMSLAFSDDFEGEVLGNMPSNFTNGSGDNTKIVVSNDIAASGTNSIRLEDANSSGHRAVFYKDFSNSCYVIASLKLNTNNQWVEILVNNEEEEGARVYFKTKNILCYYDGAWSPTLLKYEEKKWYDVKLVVDAQNHRYDFYLDGKLIAHQAGFQKKNSTTVNRLVIQTGSSTTAADIYIDDISIMQQTPPQLAAHTGKVGESIEMTFTDDVEWRKAINEISINEQIVADSLYNISSGKISIDSSVFSSGGTYKVEVKAEGYVHAKVNQVIESGQKDNEDETNDEDDANNSSDKNTIKYVINKSEILSEDIKTVIASVNGVEGSIKTKIVVDIPKKGGANSVQIVMPAAFIDSIKSKRVDEIEISTGIAAMILSPHAIDIDGVNTLIFEVKQVNNDLELTDKQKQVVGTSPVFDFDALVIMDDGSKHKIEYFKENILLKVPYILGEGEEREKITVFHMTENGDLENKAGIYNPETKRVVFTTKHFSKYIVKHNNIVFSDIQSQHWAKKYIEEMAAKGYVTGITEDVFAPDMSITRAEVTAMLVRFFDLDSKNAKSDFADISSNDWYYSIVSSAAEAGLINGYQDGTFRPNDLISRQDMAVMITRALKLYKGVIVPDDLRKYLDFVDCNLIEDYAKESVATTSKYGIMGGKLGDLFDPNNNTTRAEAVKVIYNILSMYK